MKWTNYRFLSVFIFEMLFLHQLQPAQAASPGLRAMAEANQQYHRELRALGHPATPSERQKIHNKAFASAEASLASQRNQQNQNLKNSLKRAFPGKNKPGALAAQKDPMGRVPASAPQAVSNARANVKNDTGVVTGIGGAEQVQFEKKKQDALPVQDGIIMQK